jgi:ribosomal protein L11 methyltransferase
MDYIELNCRIDSEKADLFRELLIQELADVGYESFIDTDAGLLAYIAQRDFEPEQLDSISLFSDHAFGQVKFTWDLIKDQNWNKEWESNFSPVLIANQCYIRATFHQPIPEIKYEIVIDPKMSFGTGHHETTSLMIEQMLDMPILGKSILDMGCGTGILAVFASKLGADPIIAIDIDEWAYRNSLENISLNNISNIKVLAGDKSIIPDNAYDVILANINRNILLDDMSAYAKHLKNNGLILLSGIYNSDLPVIEECAISNGLLFKKKLSKNNWVSALFQKK